MSTAQPDRSTPDAPDTMPPPGAERLGDDLFPVVGIGASAGGLEAFTDLLTHLTADTGMAFVLVQHLDPRHHSELTDLLGPATRMPVREAADGMVVHPDHVYVIPPNTNLTLARGALRLTPRADTHGPYLPFDHFLRSLARERQRGAIGVVLSGTGSDGTLGLAEVKSAGGITFAQDSASARFAGMPLSAINGGCVDFILSPQGIARELARVGRHPYVAGGRPAADDSSSVAAGEGYESIFALLLSCYGVDFTHYREATLRRRILRRMALHGEETLAGYARRLAEDRAEVEALYQDLLINVTGFFRDPEAFEALKAAVFPRILRVKGPQAPVRVWVAGCSTGQEAYSLAIALLEFLEDGPSRPPVQIFATDLSDSTALAKARAGLYPETIEAEVSAQRLRRFFTKEPGGYRVGKSVRDLCVFARHDMTRDPPFSRVDLVSCRNVLIYLGESLQRRVIPTFHYALNEGGFLLLGTAESVGRFSDLFDLVDRQHKIYARKTMPGREHPYFRVAGRAAAPPVGAGGAGRPSPGPADLQREADRIVLDRFAPAGVLVNEGLAVLEFRGRTSPYLEPPPGEPTVSLLRMAREGLAPHLRSAIQESRTHNAPIRREAVRLYDAAGARDVALHVIPVRPAGAATGGFLVLFEEARTDEGTPDPGTTLPHRQGWLPRWLPRWLRYWLLARSGSPSTAAPQEDELARLRQELTASRECLQALAQEQEAVNEELRSAHEEVLSGNEELQSTNEELETAKEELQSANEELTTVNEQLQHRNEELNQLSSDLLNLFGSLNTPIIMLDGDLRIRQFTVAAGKILNLLPADVGRPLGEIKPAIDMPDLLQQLRGVIERAQVHECEIRDRDGRWYALRIHPYRATDDRVAGAVLLLFDIDAVKRAEQRAWEASAYARAIVETVRDPLIVLDPDLRVKMANQSFYRTFQVEPGQTEGQFLYDLGDRQWDIAELRRRLGEILPRDAAVGEFDVEYTFPAIGHRTMRLNARRVRQEGPDGGLILLAIEDISERKQTEAVLRAAHDELERRVVERTAELARVNEALRAEVVRHKQAEQARRELLQRLASAQEEERRRIARELHDQMGQHLTALGLGLTALGDAAPEPSAARDRLRSLQELTDQIGKEVHRLALELRPTALDDLGLHTTLLNYIEEWSERSGVEADFHSTGLDGERLPSGVETALFRIVQEALTNVLKHAGAHRVGVVIQRFADEVLATVEDDGRGFDAEAVAGGAGRLGLLGMRERVALLGGTLTVESAPGEGTTIFVRIPLGAGRKGDGDVEAARLPG